MGGGAYNLGGRKGEGEVTAKGSKGQDGQVDWR